MIEIVGSKLIFYIIDGYDIVLYSYNTSIVDENVDLVCNGFYLLCRALTWKLMLSRLVSPNW